MVADMLIRNLAFFCLVVIFAVFVFMVETGYKSTSAILSPEVAISAASESESEFERKLT